MVHPLVEKATSNLLIGPDWAKNAEICALLNHDITYVKSIVKGIKKRLRSKDPRVQLLALTLLETMMKNCGDIVHMHVAERNIPYTMARIAKKRKADIRVREKILILIDLWQQAFRGPRARYLQFYDAYHQLRIAKLPFPQKSEGSAPTFSCQEGPLVPGNLEGPQNPRCNREEESVEDSEFPTLSMTEIQNARGVMDILAEMLNKLDPQKKEGIKKDAIMDLVRQCRTFKQRVIHLINSTTNEPLLQLGLALNDDLQCLLAKHEAIASGASVEEDKSKFTQSLIDIDDNTEDGKQLNERPTSDSVLSESPLDLLLPVASANTSIGFPAGDPSMDLLTSESFTTSGADSSLALVLAGEAQPNSPGQQDASLSDVDGPYNDVASSSHAQRTDISGTAFQLPVSEGIQLEGYTGSTVSSFNLQHDQQQLTIYRAEDVEALPLPPWEDEPTNDLPPPGSFNPSNDFATSEQYTAWNNQLVGMHASEMMGMYAHPFHNVGAPNYYPQTHFMEERMHAMSMNDAAPPRGKPSKPEDMLFGDLVHMARSKPN